jgi:hypothetical protein
MSAEKEPIDDGGRAAPKAITSGLLNLYGICNCGYNKENIERDIEEQ